MSLPGTVGLFDAPPDLPQQASEPAQEAAGALHPGPACRQLLRVRQPARGHRQAERPEDHSALTARQGTHRGWSLWRLTPWTSPAITHTPIKYYMFCISSNKDL